MARLAIAVAGGIIGSFFGMPQLGFLLGSLLGSVLFPQTQGGPKLTDLRVTSSAYGQMIPIGVGTMRIGSNIIWSHALSEHKHSGKGMSPSTYTYTWTGACGLCEGPIADVTRIWADAKLVYDKTGATSAATFNKYKLKFRLYRGTEDQLPDPAHESQVGADNALAYRGLAYVVFDDIPVVDYGNRIPNWTFEVVFNTTAPSLSGHKFTFTTGGNVATPGTRRAAVDWDTNRAYFLTNGAAMDDAGITVENIQTGATIFSANVTAMGVPSTIVDGRAFALGLDKNLYITTGSSNTTPISKLDPDSLVEIGRFGTASSSLTNARTGFVATQDIITMQIGGSNFAACIGLFNEVGVFNTDSMSVSAPTGGVFSIDADEDSVLIAPGEVVADSVGTFFVAGFSNFAFHGADPISIYRYSVTASGVLSRDLVASISPGDVDPAWSNFNLISGMAYDTSDGNVMLGLRTPDTVGAGNSKNKFIKVSTVTGAVLWAANVNVIPSGAGIPHAAVTNGEFSFIGSNAEDSVGQGNASVSGSNKVYTIITQDGTVTSSDWVGITQSGGANYDGTTGSIVFYGALDPLHAGGWSNTWGVIFANRVLGSAVSLSSVVSLFAKKVGYVDADLDLTDLTGDTVEGYVLANQASAGDTIKPLALAFNFDCVESDYQLKFVKRGAGSIVTIPKADFAYVDTKTNAVALETRQQEVDLPAHLSLEFYDPNHDYQQATQYARRPTNPVPTMYSNNTLTQNLPLVMEPGFAKQLAEMLLYTTWVERTQFKVKLPWQYLVYDPTDIVTLTLSDDTQVITRLVGIDVGVDWSSEVQSLSQSPSTYISTATTSGGLGFPQQVITGAQVSKVFYMDVPLLRDEDDTGQSFTILYWAAGGYQTGWPGIELYKSNDGSAFTDTGGIVHGMTWGAIIAPLGDPPFGPFVTDYENSIHVTIMQNGDNLSSCTYVEMCNGSNAAAIVNSATGVVEVIQFMNVVLESDGSYTLSGLFRGRRGTDVFCTGHAAGDNFVLLTDATGTLAGGVSDVNMSSSDMKVTRFFRAVTQGTLFENSAIKQVTDQGRTWQPYAPVHVAATLDGSDIDLTWARRTRLAGFWANGTDSTYVPLKEDTEKYEVDIYDALGDTVLRTLFVSFGASPTATPGVTYEAADITTDFGSTPDTLIVAVYQISGQIGRGFSYVVEVPVA